LLRGFFCLYDENAVPLLLPEFQPPAQRRAKFRRADNQRIRRSN
jgi:hypothetical protein